MHVPRCDITCPFAMLLRLPKKGVADLCLYHLQLMHVHTGIKDFLARYSYKYVRITN